MQPIKIGFLLQYTGNNTEILKSYRYFIEANNVGFCSMSD